MEEIMTMEMSKFVALIVVVFLIGSVFGVYLPVIFFGLWNKVKEK